jgi:hypothetical protein
MHSANSPDTGNRNAKLSGAKLSGAKVSRGSHLLPLWLLFASDYIV